MLCMLQLENTIRILEDQLATCQFVKHELDLEYRNFLDQFERHME